MPHSQHEEDASAAVDSAPIPVTLVTDSLEKPSLDDRDYRVIRLGNDLEALLVHDPETDKASAALDVNVGNFSDESDIPGMAHAVEHLLFMGTEKFPIENEYAEYLSTNSGSSNAYTGPTSTNYFFKISAKPDNDQEPSDTNPSPLREALDRFAQFFIEPLFLAETLDEELKAVNSENNKNLRIDTWRRTQLVKSLSNPNHPFSHFPTGNFEVLKTLPEARGINVRDKFIEFHARHYSANRMKLVVLGREPLDVLQKWVAELFSPVVNKKLPPNRWPGELPFRETDLGMQCFAKPVMDSRELNLYFPFIDEEFMFATKPSRYISHLIGHEGPGSIMSCIKSKGWADGLIAGADPVCPGTPGIFHVQVRLTEEGLENYPEIVKIFFQYITLLHESPPEEWRFQELKKMDDVEFKFKQKTPAEEFTSQISSVMQEPLPREQFLSGHGRLREFAPDVIEKALATIRPDNFCMVILSRDYPGNWDQKEKWYGTDYRRENIPKDLMKEYKEAFAVSTNDRLSALQLPHKNKFIPTNLEVERKKVDEPALYPRVVRNDHIARTWWKKDDTFWVPRANVVVSLKTPLIYASAGNNVKAELFAQLVLDTLEEDLYDAKLTGSQYIVSLGSHGLLLNVSGYNDKLLMVLEQAVTAMANFNINKGRFGRIKKLEELAAELPSVTLEGIRQFQKQMLDQVFIEVYVHGNMYKKDALKATHMVESILKPRVLPKAQWPIMRSLILTKGSNYVFRRTLKDSANVNHCVETWLYVGSRDDRDIRTKTLLLGQMLKEPVFDQLRTKEQLGYVVWSGSRYFSTTYGFRFLIQSEMTPELIDSRIEALLLRYTDTLEKMSEIEFESHKRSLIVSRLEKPMALHEESRQHWAEINSEEYDFEICQNDAARIRQLTKAEIVDFFNQHLNPSSTQRARLSIHLKAQDKAKGVDKRQEEAQKQADKEPSSGDAVKMAEKITDVRLYKAGLTPSSGVIPVKDVSDFEH
ncbi:related to insulysin precursor (metalloendopeptidase) [Fusarium fujikuroi]|nr:related to insulysin precursor (metalloendopeptidase) [Fusarium fujikuroi]